VTIETRIPRRRVVAWALWDGGSAAYNAVILTFVFSVYLTSSVGKDLPGPIDANAWLGYSTGAAGLLIALMAPVVGARADAAGRRKRATGIWTALTVATMAGLVVVRNDGAGIGAGGHLAVGLVLLGLGSIFYELGTVSYNAMLRQVSTPATIGRVSGFGWSFGYFGGIVLLLAVYVGLIAGADDGTGGLLGVPTGGGLNIRLVALVAAVWFAVLAVPLFLAVPEVPPSAARGRLGVVGSYRKLVADIRELWRADRRAVWFLAASALYRDGLVGVFTFGAVLAVNVYGIASADVLIFGIVANVTAAVGALTGGLLEDRIGPKAVIVGSIVGLLVAGTILLFLSGPAAFWVLGLFLTLFVGPAQSSSRTFLARVAPAGHEGEMFGLYATTGRAVSFLAPTLYALFITVTGTARAGIVGILVVLAAGLIALLPVAAPARGNAVSTPV
jgi:MFS transporter, UMF1 family